MMLLVYMSISCYTILMKRALDRLIEYMRAEDWDRALSLAASWSRLGEERDAIVTGHSANTSRDFYRQIGKDPDGLITEGIAALKRRYGKHL